MTKPLVSILTPTYNRSESLRAAICSVLDQDFQDFEHLIINDGGDDISNVIADFSDTRIKYFNNLHSGKAAALNFALEQSQGQYITYLDDDDIIYPNHLSLLLNALERNPCIHAAYTNSYVVYQRYIDKKWQEVYRNLEIDVSVDYSMLYWQNYIYHNNIMHTKDIINVIGNYDEQLRVLIDWDFIRRLAYKTPLVHVKEITSDYFRKVGNLKSKTSIFFNQPQLFEDNRNRILSKLPKPEKQSAKTFPAPVNFKIVESIPKLENNARILLFRSASYDTFKRAYNILLKHFPDCDIDIIGQPDAEVTLRDFPGINRIFPYKTGFFHPAHLPEELLNVLIDNNYHMGVLVFNDRRGSGYQNVIGFAKVLTLPMIIGINSETEILSL